MAYAATAHCWSPSHDALARSLHEVEFLHLHRRQMMRWLGRARPGAPHSTVRKSAGQEGSSSKSNRERRSLGITHIQVKQMLRAKGMAGALADEMVPLMSAYQGGSLRCVVSGCVRKARLHTTHRCSLLLRARPVLRRLPREQVFAGETTGQHFQVSNHLIQPVEASSELQKVTEICVV